MTNLTMTDMNNLAMLASAEGEVSGTKMKGTLEGIRKLVRAGYITKSIDRGQYRYTITDKGLEVLP